MDRMHTHSLSLPNQFITEAEGEEEKCEKRKGGKEMIQVTGRDT